MKNSTREWLHTILGIVCIIIACSIISYAVKSNNFINSIIAIIVATMIFIIASMSFALNIVHTMQKTKLIRKISWDDCTEEEQYELLCQWLKNLPYRRKHLTNNEKQTWREFFESEEKAVEFMKHRKRLINGHYQIFNDNQWSSITEALNVQCRACNKPNEIIYMIWATALYAWHKQSIGIDD